MTLARPDQIDARALPLRLRLLLTLAACCVPCVGLQAHAPGTTRPVDLAAAVERGLVTVVQEGLVSWYGLAFQDRPTASGERFDPGAMTMAHPTLPFGTRVRVTNLRNGRSVVVRVNDRGPFVGSRIADVSQAAASSLGMLRRGVATARIEVIAAGTATSRR